MVFKQLPRETQGQKYDETARGVDKVVDIVAKKDNRRLFHLLILDLLFLFPKANFLLLTYLPQGAERG